jgi:hypothetical protein
VAVIRDVIIFVIGGGTRGVRVLTDVGSEYVVPPRLLADKERMYCVDGVRPVSVKGFEDAWVKVEPKV